jgi:actin related protein 2/3 complex subunit 3
MRDFQIKTDADHLLIRLKFFAKNKDEKQIDKWNFNPFPLPGDGGFILVTDRSPARTRTSSRRRGPRGQHLLRIIFGQGNRADKWWICFAPRKFMDKEMPN